MDKEPVFKVTMKSAPIEQVAVQVTVTSKLESIYQKYPMKETLQITLSNQQAKIEDYSTEEQEDPTEPTE